MGEDKTADVEFSAKLTWNNRKNFAALRQIPQTNYDITMTSFPFTTRTPRIQESQYRWACPPQYRGGQQQTG